DFQKSAIFVRPVQALPQGAAARRQAPEPDMKHTHQEIQAYAEQYSTPPADWLEENVRRTEREQAQPGMMSSRTQGKFLELLARWIAPVRILEIGTFTGYSALCLAMGLAPGGRLHTIELRKETAGVARANFNQSEWRDRIIL